MSYRVFFFFFTVFSFFINTFLSKALANVGNRLTNTYGSCGDKTAEVQSSINKFTNMLDQMKADDKCLALKNELKNTVPNAKQVEEAIIADELAQEMKRQKDKLRDIELQIRNTDSIPKSPTTLSPGQLSQLRAERRSIQARIISLEARLGVGERVQRMNQYKPIIQATNNFFNKVGTAFTEGCMDDKPGVKNQALFSVAGIAGMLIGSSPFGLGIDAVSSVLKNFSDIDDEYETTAIDQVQSFIGIQCSVEKTQEQHCKLIKSDSLKNIINQTTEAKDCSGDCTELQNQTFVQDISNIKDMLALISNQESESDTSPVEIDPTDFYEKFNKESNGKSASKSLDDLHQFVSILENENEFIEQTGMGTDDFCNKNPSSYKCTTLDRQTAKSAIEKIKLAFQAKKTQGIRADETLRKNFMDKIQELSTGDYLEDFINLVNAYSDYQSEQCENNRENCNESTKTLVQYINNIHIGSLIDVKTTLSATEEYKDDRDQRQAETLSESYMTDFSKIFSKHALIALNNNKDPKHQTDLCMSLIGLKPLSDSRTVKETQNKIHEKCKDETLTLGDKTIRYSDYKDRNFEEKVCAFQNFLNCANGETAACIAHENNSLTNTTSPETEERETRPAPSEVDPYRRSSGAPGSR